MKPPRPAEQLRRWFEEIWNQRRSERIEEFLAPGAILHEGSVTGETLVGADAFRAHYERLIGAVPDLHFEIEQVVEDGEVAAGRMTVSGHLTGPGLGIEPNGQPFRISGMGMGRYRDGRLVEGWNNFDLLGLFRQIGALRVPDPPFAKR